MSKIKLHWTAAGLAVVLSACAPGVEQSDVGFAQPAAAEAEPTLIVENSYFGDMDIFALLGSMRMRLGSVNAGGTAQMRIPRALLARPEIQFQADPVGPDVAFTFPPISLRPGNRVELMVAPRLAMSSYAIW